MNDRERSWIVLQNKAKLVAITPKVEAVMLDEFEESWSRLGISPGEGEKYTRDEAWADFRVGFLAKLYDIATEEMQRRVEG